MLCSYAHAEQDKEKDQAKKYLRDGNRSLKKGEYEAAYKRYKKADKLYPSPIIKYSLGNVMYKMKRHAYAELYYQRFLAAEGKKPEKLVDAARIKLAEIQKVISKKPTGGLLIKSIPSGAKVTISGNKIEKPTPVTVRNLAPRMHTIVLEKAGIYYYKGLQVVQSDKYRKVAIPLRRLAGSIDVTSNPPEAMITLNKNYAGKTPKVLKGLEAGLHELILSRPGYATWTKAVSLTGGNLKQSVVAELTKMGKLQVQSNPSGASVFHGDRLIGKTPLSINAVPKVYHIRLELGRRKTVNKVVTVESGRVARIMAPMEFTEEEIRRQKMEEEAKRKRAEELARKKAAAQARRKAAALARKKAAEEARRIAAKRAEREREEERKRKETEARKSQRRASIAVNPDAVEFKPESKKLEPEPPFYKKWWFWTVVGVAVVGGTVGGVVAATTGGASWVASGVDGRFDRTTFHD